YGELALSATDRRLLRYDEATDARWEAEGAAWQVIFLRWNPGKTASHLAKGHTPEVCLTASGHNLSSTSELMWFLASGLRMPFRKYAVLDEARPLHVFYCLWDDRA